MSSSEEKKAEAKSAKATSSTESIKVIPFYGTDTSKGGVEPREFFTKAEVFAATKGFKQALLQDRVKAGWETKTNLSDNEKDILKQDDDAKHFLIMSCRGDAFAIVESQETAFGMYQALKDRYDSKKTKDLVKATAKLEKCFMKSDLEDPYLWILEMERLNREVEKCENGTKRSEEQMQATILARLPKRRYEAVITNLNGKIGNKEMAYKDFVAEIVGHYEMFIEPYKNKKEQAKDQNKHIAFNTTGGKGWKAFKGKCNKCGKQGHKGRDCRSGVGAKNDDKFSGKCFKCNEYGHMARDCTKKVESTGMFVGMTYHGCTIDKDNCKTRKDETNGVEAIDWDGLALEILQDIADNNAKMERNSVCDNEKVEDDVTEVEKPMSWYDMCETSDEEDDFAVIEETHEPEDGIQNQEPKNDDDYQMVHSRTGSEWKWDEEVFVANASKTVYEFNEYGYENWLIDSGATTHVSTNTKCMTNLKTAYGGEFVRVGNNEKMKATAIGDLTLEQEGTGNKLTLTNVMVVPDFATNLVSVGRLTDKGNEFITDKYGAKLIGPGGETLKFTKGLNGMAYLEAKRTKTGQNGRQVFNVEAGDDVKKKVEVTMDINEAHRKFAHATENVVRKILQQVGIKAIGKMETCDGCARAKATQKRTKKVTLVKAENPGERLYMDTSGPYSETMSGSKYWFKIVDDKTRKTWDSYGAKKNGIRNFLSDLLAKLKASGRVVKYVRCDNAGEHMTDLKKLCEGEYSIQLEYTAPHTPQHNGVVERMFARDSKRALAMMIHAGWTKEMQGLLWAEATKTAAVLGNNLPNTRNHVPPDELFYGTKSDIYKSAIEFGRVGYVTNRATMKGKFKEKSSKMVFVGYAENHARDVYRMYNPDTKRIVETRDIYAWADIKNSDSDIRLQMTQVYDPKLVLQQVTVPVPVQAVAEPVQDGPAALDNYDDYDEPHLIPDYSEELEQNSLLHHSETGRMEVEGATTVPNDTNDSASASDADDDVSDDSSETNDDVSDDSSDDVSDDDESVEVSVDVAGGSDVSEDDDAEVEADETPKTSRLENEMRRLGIDEPVTIEDDTPGVRTRSMTDQTAFNAVLTSDPGEPKTFRQAMDGPNKDKWVPSAKAEINNFLSRDAWQKFPRKDLLDRKPIPVKWIFKVKEEQDGTQRYKSRIVLKGYVMVPGVDYTESFSPVATDTTVRTSIAMALFRQKEGWTIEMIDIEAAFLNAELESDRPVYAEWPEGMVELGFISEDERKTNCIKLTRAMYGGVDVPRLFMKTLCKYLTETMKMSQSLVDPCLYFWKNQNLEVTLMAVVHVDDVILMGTKTVIEKFKGELRQRFNISDLGKLKKHLGVWYDWKTDRNTKEIYIVASMTKLETEIVESYEKLMGKNVKTADTPGFPNSYLSKNDGETVMMTEYRSLVGKIMYLMTKLAPDLANPARELAQHLSNPGEQHWKALERLIGYVKAKKFDGLVYRKPKELRAISFVDSDYAKNTDNRKSISSGLHTIGGTLVNWESKTQHVVTLSSTEAEYISLAKGACENKFVTMLMDEVMRYPSEHRLCGKIYEDNLGAIYLVKNQHVGARTKHIDVRAHFIRELENNGYVEVKFIRSEENSADILNKNCPEKLHTKHATMLRTGNLNCWREDVEDKRLLSYDGTSKADVMTVQNNGLSSDTEMQFTRLYANSVNGIQQPRLTQCDSKNESSTIEGDNNEGWNVVQRKAKKVSFTSTREQVGKIGSRVKLGRSNLI
jgi:Reverse transcriptase (RNA-dependent DNA polymerase)/Zinc knuckle